MALSLTSQDRLHGSTREEILALLGPETGGWQSRGAKSLSYSIRAGHRYFPSDCCLVIHLDDSDRVSGCRIIEYDD